MALDYGDAASQADYDLDPPVFRDIHAAIAGREAEVLQALGINPRRKGHQRCPLGTHEDKHPSWRWDAGKRRWFCSCGNGSAVDAVMTVQGIDAGEAIRWIRQLLDGAAPTVRRVALNPPPEPPPEATHAAVAAEAARRWDAARPVDPHYPYLIKKAVPPHGLRQQGNRLLVPLQDIDGRLWSLQTIAPDGTKLFGKGARVAGLFCPLGLAGDPERLIICEGWATAATLHEETGWPVLAAMNAGNLMPVARAARQAWPEAEITLAADNDRHRHDNPGAGKATAAAIAIRARLAVPQFPEGATGSDFNDLAKLDPGAVAAAIAAAELPEPAATLPPPPVGQAENLLSTTDAAELGRQAVRGFIEKLLTWTPTAPDNPLDYNAVAPPPVVALRASVGLGKSEMILRELARPELAGKRIHYLVPLIKLSAEFMDRYNALAGPESPEARLFLGRDQILPDGSLMCEKRDLARQLGRQRLNVQQHLCERRVKLPEVDPETGKQKTALERCPHFQDCRYQAQRADRRPGIIFLAHEYAFLRDAPPADGIVIDERYYPASLGGAEGRGYFVVLDDLRLPRPGIVDDVNADLVAIGERCIRALRAGGRLADFAAEAVTVEQARWATGKEYGRLQPLDISPAMPQSRQEERIAAYKQQVAAKLGKFFALLAAAFDAGADPRFTLREDLNGDDRPEQRVFMVWSEPVRLAPAPTLLIDADLDATIARRHFPQLKEVVVAEVRPTAYFGTQIVDRRVSMQMLCVSDEVRQAIKKTGRLPDKLSAKDRTRVRNCQRLRQIAEVKAAAGRRVLIISYKAAEEVLNTLPAIPGVEISHFGALRGRDRWKGCNFAIVAGAPLANTEDLERTTNALHYLDPEPLATIEPGADGRKRYPDTDAVIHMADGARVPVRVPTHPDPRARAVMAQVFSEVAQALGRLRLPHRPADEPCELLVLTNVPTGLPMHRTTTWQDATTVNPLDLMRARGIVPTRLRDVAKVLPELVESQAEDPRHSVRMALTRAGVDPRELLTPPYRVDSIGECLQLVPFRCRIVGERQSSIVGVDLNRHPDPRTALESFFGPLDRFEPIDTPPAIAEPPALEPSAPEPPPPPSPEPTPPPPPEPSMPPAPQPAPPVLEVELATCCECGQPIDGQVTSWWGGEPAHDACALDAWRRDQCPEPEPPAAGPAAASPPPAEPEADRWCGWPGPCPEQMRQRIAAGLPPLEDDPLPPPRRPPAPLRPQPLSPLAPAWARQALSGSIRNHEVTRPP